MQHPSPFRETQLAYDRRLILNRGSLTFGLAMGSDVPHRQEATANVPVLGARQIHRDQVNFSRCTGPSIQPVWVVACKRISHSSFELHRSAIFTK